MHSLGENKWGFNPAHKKEWETDNISYVFEDCNENNWYYLVVSYYNCIVYHTFWRRQQLEKLLEVQDGYLANAIAILKKQSL